MVVVAWARWKRVNYPALWLLHATPNAAKRSKKLAAMMLAEGLRSGVPDLHLPVARCGYHSLYIEMKTEKGKTSADQDWWIQRLRAEGNMVNVCRSAEAGCRTLADYLCIPIEEGEWLSV